MTVHRGSGHGRETRERKGFRLTHNDKRGPTVWIDYWSPALESALGKSDVSHVVIEPWWEDRGKGIEFLGRIGARVLSLTVSTDRIPDVSVVNALTNLERLSCQSPVDDIDFSQLMYLRECLLSNAASPGNIDKCAALEDLALMNVRVSDLRRFAKLQKLRRLSLNNLRGVTSLTGIERLPLRELRLVHLRRLRSLAPVARLEQLRKVEISGCRQSSDVESIGQLRSLRALRIDHGPALPSFDLLARLQNLEQLEIWGTTFSADELSVMPLTRLRKLRVLHLAGGIRQVVDIEHVGEMTSLEVLRIEGAPGFASLEYLRDLRDLQVLSLWKTPIEDGDLSALLDLPQLREIEAIDPHKKHYSHSAEELNAILFARRAKAPPRADESSPTGAGG